MAGTPLCLRATPLAPSFYSLLKTNFNFDEVADHLDRDEEEAVAPCSRGTDHRAPPSHQGAAEPSAPRLLSELPPGRDAVVDSVDDSGPIGRRLLDLGLLPGTPLRALRRAPLGDPSVFELRGYRLCLRKSESSRVRLRTRSHTPPPRS